MTATSVNGTVVEVPVRERSKASKTYFRTDVEGLRAIAVVSVVAFHAAVPFFPGGFVGVDIFFVISGFLITGLLLREVQSTGRISFRSFYARRARRILPSATITLLAVTVASALLLPLLQVYNTARDLLAAALYVSNWQFIALGTDYLAHSTADSPVLHYWSLAVEEQFYLAWPLIVLGAVTLARRWPLNGTRVIAGSLGLVTAASLVLSLVLTVTDPKLAYMATTTRAWEFGLGAMVAVFGHVLQRLSQRTIWQRVGWLVGWGGFAAIVFAIVKLDSTTPFPGTAALIPTLGTAAIIAGGMLVGRSRTSIGGVLSMPSVRYIGRLSFGWYLWHWPVLVLVEAKTGTLPWPVRCLLMLAALVLAAGTLHLVEMPIARWKQVAKNVAPALALGLLCMVVSAGLSMAVGSNAVSTLAAGATATKINAADFTKVFGAATGKNSGPVIPSALDAASDKPAPSSCLLDHEVGVIRGCEVGVKGGAPVVLFGDSHANQWLPAIEKIAEERKWDVSVFTKSGCPVQDLAPRKDGSRFSEKECIDWRHASLAMIATLKPALILVSSLHTYIPDTGEALTAWNTSLDSMRKTGAPIVYIRDTPELSTDIPTCISGALDDWSKCAFPQDTVKEPVIQESIVGRENDVSIVDMDGYFCTGGTCPAVKNGVLLYRDNSHITATAALALKPALEQALVDTKAIPASTK